jgi:GMP synthase (glutamine-hydrolysing)
VDVVKPFLLLATRPEDVAADEEYAQFLACTGLQERDLVRRRLEQRPLGVLDLAQWSGVLLGGSPFTVSDPQEQKSALQVRVESELRTLLGRVVAEDVPFLGACYGIGTLGRALGAVVDRRYGEPIGPVTITLTPEGRDDPLLGALPAAFEAFVGHKEAITELPGRAVRLAGSAACPVQAFRVGRNVYATQFHPELDLEGVCTRIDVYKNAGYFPPSEAETLKQRSRSVEVLHPMTLLANFVSRYRR